MYRPLLDRAISSCAQGSDQHMHKPIKMSAQKPGYHIKAIRRGTLGESSKIREELDELEDAELQGVKIMRLVELSDLLGAVEAYLEKHFPSVQINDLLSMSAVTKRAFINGHRKPRA